MAEANLIQFTVGLQQFAKDTERELGEVVQVTALTLDGRLVYLTPKDTGRAAGSWIVSLDTPSSDMLPEGEYTAFQDNAGAAQHAQDEAARVLSSLPIDPFHVVWLVNNLPYIEALNNGHSQQAPAGFVELAVAEVEANLQGLTRA